MCIQLCKIDSEGKARKVVGCSCVVVQVSSWKPGTIPFLIELDGVDFNYVYQSHRRTTARKVRASILFKSMWSLIRWNSGCEMLHQLFLKWKFSLGKMISSRLEKKIWYGLCYPLSLYLYTEFSYVIWWWIWVNYLLALHSILIGGSGICLDIRSVIVGFYSVIFELLMSLGI